MMTSHDLARQLLKLPDLPVVDNHNNNVGLILQSSIGCETGYQKSEPRAVIQLISEVPRVPKS